MTKIILHIGGEKTGTTSLQTAMAKNADVLFAKYGLLYPTDEPFFNDNAHFPLAAAFLDRSQCNILNSRLRREPDELRLALDSLIAKSRPKTLVFSAEHFSSRFRRSQLPALARFLSPHQVEILFYVRPQDELALSSFGTGIQCGEKQWFDADTIREEDRYFNHLLVADEWAGVFGTGNLRVRSYAGLAHGGLLADFLAQLGIDHPPELEDVGRLNETVSLFEARVLFQINRHLPTWEEALSAGDEGEYQVAQALRQRLLEVLRSDVTPPAGQPLNAIAGPAVRARIMARFESSNSHLARKYGAAIPTRADSPGASVEPADFDADAPVLDELLIWLLRKETALQAANERLRRRTVRPWAVSLKRCVKSLIDRTRQ